VRTIRAYLGLTLAWASHVTQPYVSPDWTLWLAATSYRIMHKEDREAHPAGERAIWLYERRKAIKLINEIDNDGFNRY